MSEKIVQFNEEIIKGQIKELVRGSVQYATEQVETAGKRGSLAAADGGRRAIKSLKQREEPTSRQDRTQSGSQTPTEPKKNSLSQTQEQTSYPSAKRDGNRQAIEQRRVQRLRSKSVDDQFRIDAEVKGHSNFDVPRPQMSQANYVGIVAGRNESGNLLIIHCASGYNNVVITGLAAFTSIGRPNYYAE